jgi:hypothetical protein
MISVWSLVIRSLDDVPASVLMALNDGAAVEVSMATRKPAAELPSEEWTPGYAARSSACSGVM